MTSALLAITLLSLLGIVLALAVTWRVWRSYWRLFDQVEEANEAERKASAGFHRALLMIEDLKKVIADAERRARARESKYSRRQPETPAPLPENAQ